MKISLKIYAPLFLFSILSLSRICAQSGSHFAKLGLNLIALSDGQLLQEKYAGALVSYEYQFTGMVAAGGGIGVARLLDRAPSSEAGKISSQLNTLELELRCYPNKKGRGFYTGASMLLYQHLLKQGALSSKKLFYGSHIQFGFQSPLTSNFYVQANVQAGVLYGHGARYGLNAMLVRRF